MAFHNGATRPFESGVIKDQLFFWIDGHDPIGYPGSGTTMFDLVGSRNMTITGATHQTTAINSFFDIDGGTNDLSLASTDFRFQTSFSCDCWFNIDTFDQQWFRLVDFWNSTGKSGWMLNRYFTTNKIEWRLEEIDITGDGTFVTGDLSTGVWYHIAGVYNSDNNTAQLYLNGSLVDSGNTSGTLNDWSETVLLVGNSSANEAFNGQVGPVRVYTKALTASEVLKNYTVERTRFGV